MNAVFFHRAQAAGGDFDVYRFIQFRHENSFLLQIRIFSDATSRVEFGGAGAVGIAASDDGTLFGYRAYFFHPIRKLK